MDNEKFEDALEEIDEDDLKHNQDFVDESLNANLNQFNSKNASADKNISNVNKDLTREAEGSVKNISDVGNNIDESMLNKIKLNLSNEQKIFSKIQDNLKEIFNYFNDKLEEKFNNNLTKTKQIEKYEHNPNVENWLKIQEILSDENLFQTSPTINLAGSLLDQTIPIFTFLDASYKPQNKELSEMTKDLAAKNSLLKEKENEIDKLKIKVEHLESAAEAEKIKAQAISLAKGLAKNQNEQNAGTGLNNKAPDQASLLDRTFVSQSRETEIFTDVGRIKTYIQKLRTERQNLNKKYTEDMAYLESKHKSEVQRMKQNHQNEIEMISKSNKIKEGQLVKEKEALDSEYKSKIQAIEAELREQKLIKIKNDSEIENLRHENDIKKTELKNKLENIKDLNKQVAEMQNYMKEGDDEYKKMVSKCEGLNKEIRRLKDENHSLSTENEQKELKHQEEMKKKDTEFEKMSANNEAEKNKLAESNSREMMKLRREHEKIIRDKDAVINQKQRELNNKISSIEELEQELELEKYKANELKELKNREIKELKQKLNQAKDELAEISKNNNSTNKNIFYSNGKLVSSLNNSVSLNEGESNNLNLIKNLREKINLIENKIEPNEEQIKMREENEKNKDSKESDYKEIYEKKYKILEDKYKDLEKKVNESRKEENQNNEAYENMNENKNTLKTLSLNNNTNNSSNNNYEYIEDNPHIYKSSYSAVYGYTPYNQRRAEMLNRNNIIGIPKSYYPNLNANPYVQNESKNGNSSVYYTRAPSKYEPKNQNNLYPQGNEPLTVSANLNPGFNNLYFSNFDPFFNNNFNYNYGFHNYPTYHGFPIYPPPPNSKERKSCNIQRNPPYYLERGAEINLAPKSNNVNNSENEVVGLEPLTKNNPNNQNSININHIKSEQSQANNQKLPENPSSNALDNSSLNYSADSSSPNKFKIAAASNSQNVENVPAKNNRTKDKQKINNVTSDAKDISEPKNSDTLNPKERAEYINGNNNVVVKSTNEYNYGYTSPIPMNQIDDNLPEILKPLSERKQITRIQGYKSSINAILPLSDGNFIVASEDGEIAVYVGKSGELVNKVDEFSGKSIKNLTLLSDNSIIACGFRQMKRIIFSPDYKTYNIIQVLSEGYEKYINKATELTTFDLITCGEDPKVPVWREDEITGVFVLYNKSILDERVNSIIQANENTFVTSSCNSFTGGNNVLRFFNIDNYQQIKKIEGLSCSPYPNSMILLNDFTLSVGLNDGILLIDLENYKTIKTITESIICLENITNDVLLSSSITNGSKKLKEWSFDGRKLVVVGTQNLHSKSISAMSVLENGYLVTGSYDNTLVILD